MPIMLEGMLPRQGKPCWSNAGFFKYRSVCVEACECNIDSVQGVFIDTCTTNEVAEVEKCTESLDHLGWDVACYSREKDLFERGSINSLTLLARIRINLPS